MKAERSHGFQIHLDHSPGFTLIELLIVIAIIAILAVVVVLVLQPQELLRQSRDSNRVSDMSTLVSALNLYSEDQSGASMGNANTVYVSVPDPAISGATTSTCSTMGLPALPSTYSYQCSSPQDYKNVNGTGWIPVRFSTISTGSPLGSLPADPTNNSSSRLYYTYTTNGTQFEVTAPMESQKYGVGGSNDVISNDGAPLATVYAKGSSLSLEPLDYGDPTLVGWWPLNEGSGSIAYDDSGNNATGSWSGAYAGSSGHYSAGNVFPWAGYFDGNNDGVTIPGALAWSGQLTFMAWVNSPSWYGFIAQGSNFSILPLGSQTRWELNGVQTNIYDGWAPSTNTWHQVVMTYNGTTVSGYVDGKLVGSATNNNGLSTGNSLTLAYYSGYVYSGLIDDIRLYNRALSATKIAAMYNGGK